jgi:hypothetical protein
MFVASGLMGKRRVSTRVVSPKTQVPQTEIPLQVNLTDANVADNVDGCRKQG